MGLKNMEMLIRHAKRYPETHAFRQDMLLRFVEYPRAVTVGHPVLFSLRLLLHQLNAEMTPVNSDQPHTCIKLEKKKKDVN